MALFVGSGFVVALVKDLVRDEIEKKMRRSEKTVVAGMVKKGDTPDQKGVPWCVRDVLFRLWRSVVLLGDIADKIRDYSDDSVVPKVVAALGPAPQLPEIVTETRKAIMAWVEETAG